MPVETCMDEADGWKLIAAHLKIHLNGGPFLAIGDHFCFCCQNYSPRTDFAWLQNQLVRGRGGSRILQGGCLIHGFMIV